MKTDAPIARLFNALDDEHGQIEASIPELNRVLGAAAYAHRHELTHWQVADGIKKLEEARTRQTTINQFKHMVTLELDRITEREKKA